jgi:S1-C subfamily serine protease
MQTHISHRASSHRQSWLFHALIALGITFFSFIGLIGITPTAYASSNPGGNISDPVVSAVDIARPAVVRIFTNINSQVTVHFPRKHNITFPRREGSYSLTLSGTGAFISPHGDILTADHVVNPPHDDQQMIQYIYSLAAPDIADYINKYVPSLAPVTQDDVTNELSSGQLLSDLHFGKNQSQVYLSTDYTGPLTATNLQKVPSTFQAPVDRIEAQSGPDEKDVAIVHVNLNDMASIQLADSSGVHEQDVLTIIGFPGNGDVSMEPTNLLTSSVNQLIVSSIKTTDQGAQVIQVGGNVEHGDSGGPALDSNGNVVGVVSFASSDQGSTSFLQASNSAEQLIQKIHLDMTPGPFEMAWSQAFNDMRATAAGHWHKALSEFTTLHSNYPLFQAIMPYLQYTQSQAQQERIARPSTSHHSQTKTTSPLVWILLAAIAILFLTLATLVLALKRQTKLQPWAKQLSPSSPQSLLAEQNTGALVALDVPSTKPPTTRKAPLTPVILRPLFPTEAIQAQQNTDAMIPFGAPSASLPVEEIWREQPTSGPLATPSTSAAPLRPELDPSNARFYSMWGGSDIPNDIAQIELEAMYGRD